MLRDLRLRRCEDCPEDGDGLDGERRDGVAALWHIRVDGDQIESLPHVRDERACASGFAGAQLVSWVLQYHPDGHRVLGGLEARRARQVAFSENLERVETSRSGFSIHFLPKLCGATGGRALDAPARRRIPRIMTRTRHRTRGWNIWHWTRGQTDRQLCAQGKHNTL